LKKLLKAAKMFKTEIIAEEVMTKWIEALELAVNLSTKLKMETKKEMEKDDEIDEVAQEEYDDRFESANRLLQITMDSCGFYMKLYKQKIEQTLINKFGGIFYNITKSSQQEDELHYAMCFYADLMENCSEPTFTQGSVEVLNSCINFWNNLAKDINSQHTSAFLVGVIAKRMDKNTFKQYLPTVVPKLVEVINHADCFNEERAEFTDNAIGALGKICLFQLTMDNQESVDMMTKFLSMMPIHHDSVEAQAVNKMFLEQINSKNENMMKVEANLKDVLMKMNEFMRTKPELEILDDTGSSMLNSISF